MNKPLTSLRLVTSCLAFAFLCSCAFNRAKKAEATPPSSRHRTLLDADWLFHRGDIESSNEVIAANFNDAEWQKVQLPHDYVLDGTYVDSTNKMVRAHAYLPYEVAWYRKHFSVPASDEGKILRLDFDGIFCDSEVWLNGHYLGRHLSGYTPFSFDATHLVQPGENIITVRVDPRQWEGWWYEGGGIYRHVWLTALAPLHVAQWGTYVVSKVPNGEQGADEEADVTIQTTLENNSSSAADCEVIYQILDSGGRVLQTHNVSASVHANSKQDVVQQPVIPHPKLWSLESPNLYQLRTTILQNGKAVDATTTTFGIRTIHYDVAKGFFLNGKHVEIQGVANHQDYPAVGIAVPDSLQPWRVAQLKKMGCNGWRTAHNPPNEALLDACDRQGMLVMDENRHLGDTYRDHSPTGTTATNFSDLATMILRDRNHPSIIMWSMCNEEGLQGKKEGADIFSAMMRVVHEYDKTRPITCAMNGGWLSATGIADVEDIIGVNYNIDKYDKIHRRHPDKAMFGSEDTNEKTTRGEYQTNRVTGMCSGYNLSNKGWLAVVNRPFMCGSFTWTGFDYKGEPNPYGWPDVSNNTGLMDCCGFPKDKYYYFESCWSAKPMVHLLPDSWNWNGKEGHNIRVIAFSNARRVELFLNGQSLGAKDMPHDDFVEWQVPYQPGKLVAKAYTDGKMIATETLETTGAPARLVLSPGRKALHADSEDAVVVPVSILDAQGRVVPDSSNRVTFQLSGGGRILGVGNGDPSDHDPDRADNRKAFHGHCVVVIEAGVQSAKLKLVATSPGLAGDVIGFKVR